MYCVVSYLLIAAHLLILSTLIFMPGPMGQQKSCIMFHAASWTAAQRMAFFCVHEELRDPDSLGR